MTTQETTKTDHAAGHESLLRRTAAAGSLTNEPTAAMIAWAAAEIDRLKAERDELRNLGLVVCDYVRRCQLYGPADALRWAADRFRKRASDSCPHKVIRGHDMDGATTCTACGAVFPPPHVGPGEFEGHTS